jgi:glycosyltransferase involved in cell wall biosynthesis
MAEIPTVSVCVPTYNYGRFLSQCIQSVQAQTLTDWDLVICDDCSTDETAAIVRGFAAQDSRIRYILNEKRLGMNGNLKWAAESGRGQYIKMLCSDDWLLPECLEVLSSLMERNPQVVLATSAEINCNESGEPLQTQFLFGEPVSIIPGEKMLDRMARGEGFGGNSSFMIRASAYRAIGGYDENLLYAADYDLAARLCRVGEYLHADQPLFYGRIQPAASSSVNPGKLLDVIDWFEIPRKVFQPRRFLNREWRRYQLLTGKLTARYLVNISLQHLRGEHSYARGLTKLLLRYGNFWLGVPLLLTHIPWRLYNRLTRQGRASKRTLGTEMTSRSTETS